MIQVRIGRTQLSIAPWPFSGRDDWSYYFESLGLSRSWRYLAFGYGFCFEYRA